MHSETKVEARTTSKVVTPKRLRKNKLDDKLTDKNPSRSPFRIKDTVFLKHFRDNRNSRVDRVGDYQHESLWGRVRNFSCQAFYNTRIDLVLFRYQGERKKREIHTLNKSSLIVAHRVKASSEKKKRETHRVICNKFKLNKHIATQNKYARLASLEHQQV